MPKQRSHEEFVNLVMKNNPKLHILSKYKNAKTKVLYSCDCGYIGEGNPTLLLKGKGCPICGNSLLKTQEQFEKEVHNVLPNIKIVGRYKNRKSKVKTKCLIDGYEWEPQAGNLVTGHGCPVCSGRAVMQGINDMLTTNPEIKTFLVNKDDGYKYTAGSHKHINFKCPECGNIRNLEIKSVISQGFSCTMCSDGISFPNKFARSLLKQLKVNNLIFEYHPDWAGKYFYDNYFEYNNHSYILEMDGIFHYKNNTMNQQTKEQSQEIDSIKDNLAKLNNVTMIRIDCRKSDPYFIEQNIRNSILNDLFDLSIVNWGECNKYASSSYVKEVCLYYQENKMKYSREDVSKYFHIHSTTLSNYIKIGKSVGWIKDDISDSLLASYQVNNPKSKRLLVKDILTNSILYDFKSINLCIKYFGEKLNTTLNQYGIQYAIEHCNGVYHGYIFEYFK